MVRYLAGVHEHHLKFINIFYMDNVIPAPFQRQPDASGNVLKRGNSLQKTILKYLGSTMLMGAYWTASRLIF
jgi:hypothetical protein